MKAISVAAFVALAVVVSGCKSDGDAFADEVCACKDQECVDKTFKAYEEKVPALKTKLSETDKLPEGDKKVLEKAFGCVAKLAK